jgi:hypothetical protein
MRYGYRYPGFRKASTLGLVLLRLRRPVPNVLGAAGVVGVPRVIPLCLYRSV